LKAGSDFRTGFVCLYVVQKDEVLKSYMTFYHFVWGICVNTRAYQHTQSKVASQLTGW